ncbi:MAG: bifunctional response regulator/alkaline phosphatase family protein [Candidatus Latescibacterota bacterium]|nr:bifunctional response regulator/alkaline phosphatase family protein [Candidatus Latescibacterota bacterium]
MDARHKVLWADDEIDLLRSHHLYLSERGYEVTPVTNGEDAIALAQTVHFDLILLDEMMPGLDGLSTLEQLKTNDPNIPIIMITKNEEEHLMDEAIGRRIDDYLTKPVNPSQIFMACKKILDARQIRQSQAGQAYVSKAQQIREWLSGDVSWRNWIDVHRLLCEWDIEIGRIGDPGLQQMIEDQRKECNHAFARYVVQNYPVWVDSEQDSPPLSVDVVPETVAPLLERNRKVFLIVIDCLRLDHWMILEPMVSEFFNVRRNYQYSILPTATPYARNAIFAGLFPAEIARKYKKLWSDGGNEDEGSLNRHEHRFLDDQIADMGIQLDGDSRYVKILDAAEGQSLARKVESLGKVPLVSAVYNFLDMLVHGRSHSQLLREIAPDECGFRSLVLSWFENSSLFELLKKLASATDYTVVITTDHGAVKGTRATMVHGDRSTSSSLRYKLGRNLRCDIKDALLIDDPEAFGLPHTGLGSNYLIAKEDFYFVYPTNFNEHQRQYKDSFQHGGISLEEMILPLVTLEPS